MTFVHTERRPILLIALTPKGWGETAFAVSMGRELIEAGYDVYAFTWDSMAGLFHGSGIEVKIVPEATMPFLGIMLDDIVQSIKPIAIVLCDIVTSVRTLRRAGVNPDSVLNYGVPVAGVDTWNSSVAGPVADLFGQEQLDANALLESLPRRLLPVPFLTPDVGVGACSFLPHCRSFPRRIRQYVRKECGVGYGDKFILFCTSPWQHGPYDNADGQRLALTVPRLISEYLVTLGSNVHLVHVGPYKYEGLSLDSSRYHWMPPQRADIFDSLVASADLLLSLNISAVSTIKAALSGLPVVVLGNSYQARTRDELEISLRKVWHPTIEKNVASLLPLYPFTLWPLGFKSYLAPSLKDNPFLDALRMEELLAADSVIETVHKLLFSSEAIEELRHAQDAYKKRLELLPSPASMLERLLSAPLGS